MKRYELGSIATSYRRIVVGLLAGLAIFGVGGRVAMRVISMAISDVPELSLLGTVRVLVTGALAGLVGAVLYQVFGLVWRQGSWWRAVAFGIITFIVVAVLVSLFIGSISAPGWQTAVVASVFGVLFILFGIVLEWDDRKTTKP